MEELLGVEIVSFEEYYDGALTGVAAFDGTDTGSPPLPEDWHRERPRRFRVHRLTTEDAISIESRISDFETMTTDENWSKYHPTDDDDLGYQAYAGETIGWFAFDVLA